MANEENHVRKTKLLPSDAEAIADAITWLIVAERERPDCPGVAITRQRLALILAGSEAA